jgi:ApaG protein
MIRDALNALFQHVATTAGVTVRVSVNFMPEQSRVEAGRWFWVYHIRLENNREDVCAPGIGGSAMRAA